MKKELPAVVVIAVSVVGFVVALSAQAAKPVAPGNAKTGTITGHVKMMGSAPGNPVIRMGADPVCAALARSSGALPIQQFVIVDGNGGVANTYVALQGTFAATPVSTEPITINQRNCVYLPRVIAGRVGQTLKIVNQDTTLHNLHSLSLKNVFNVTQPKSGMVFSYTLKTPETMVRLKCDVHSWMLGYIGVSSHPYFAVSGNDGSFTIANVPPGRYTIKTWHERFGEQTHMVTVTAGGTATSDFTYNGAATPKATRMIEDLVVPLLASAAPFHHHAE
jgi:plastocyanin